MSSRRATNAKSNIVLSLIQAVAESPNVIPPLQSAAKDVLRIIQLVKAFSSNSDEWKALGFYV
ncbi:hypothetical protein RhiLY_05152 [Ceratobasidium sp. AG-Ba]|nr:hypothetical protein RhiLY_05152 [Ceratobasidium sp. AG-Ba]